jgi:hypothetical protein
MTVLRSQVAWLLAAIHAGWFLLAIANMSPPDPGLAQYLEHGGHSSATILAGRPYHWHYESLPLKLLPFVDLPAWLAGGFLTIALSPLSRAIHPSLFAWSYIGAAILLLLSTCQWMIIGARIQIKLASNRWGKLWLAILIRHFAQLLVCLLLLTAISVPVVNQRRRDCGFCHGGISFW